MGVEKGVGVLVPSDPGPARPVEGTGFPEGHKGVESRAVGRVGGEYRSRAGPIALPEGSWYLKIRSRGVHRGGAPSRRPQAFGEIIQLPARKTWGCADVSVRPETEVTSQAFC